MKTGLRALVFVLAVPLMAWAISSDARDRMEGRWSRGLQREFRAHGFRASDRALNRYSLATLCSDSRRSASTPPCRAYNRTTGAMAVAAGTAGIGALLLAGVMAAGAAARRRRGALVLGLRPAVYVTVLITVLLLVAQGWLGVHLVSVSAGMLGASVSSLSLSFTAAAVLLVGLAAARAVRIARHLASPPRMFAQAVASGPGTGLGQILANLRRAEGAPGDVHVVAGIAPAIFLSASGARTVDGRRDGLVLHLSLSMARILSRSEFTALVAADLSGLRRTDGVRDGRLWDSWARLQEERARLSGAGGLRQLIALPVLWMLEFLVDAYRGAVSLLWLEREAEADLGAVEGVGRREYAVALIKTAAFAPAWEATLRAMDEAAANGEQYRNASLLFAETAAANASRERVLASIANGAGSLRPRLERLGLEPASLVDVALDLRPVESAIELIDGASAIEEHLTTGRHLQLLRR